MADLGAQVVEAHRRGQVRLAAELMREVLLGWRTVNPRAVEATATPFVRSVLGMVRTRRSRSRRLSAAYLRLLRALRTGRTLPPLDSIDVPRGSVRWDELFEEFLAAGGEETPRPDDRGAVLVDDFTWPEPDEEADERSALVSVVVTGPTRAHRRVRDLRDEPSDGRGRLDDPDFLADLDAAMRDVGTSVAGAAEREALRGGRDLLDAAQRRDRRVIGWARITSTNPCSFCAMLASRGAVYRSAERARYGGQTRRRGTARMPDGWEDWSPGRLADWEAGEGIARFHAHCRCTLMPVYSREDWLPEASRQLRELYEESTRGLSGPQARAAFRRAMRERRRS